MAISYTVGQDTVLQSGIVVPTWRKNQTTNTWVTIPTSNIPDDLAPIDDPSINVNFPSAPEYYGGTGNWLGIMDAWNGATNNDTTIHFPLQGGHDDYGGNDALVLDLLSNAPTYVRTHPPTGWDGTVTNDSQESTGRYSDGRARSIHSYNKPIYHPKRGPHLTVTGNASYAGTQGKEEPLSVSAKTGNHFFFGTVFTALSGESSGSGSCYDPSRDYAWFRSKGTAPLAYYDFSTNTWTNQASSLAGSGSVSLTYMPLQDRIFWSMSTFANNFAIYNPNNDTYTTPALSGSFVGYSNIPGSSQFVYLPAGADGAGTYGSLAVWDNSSDTTLINVIDIPLDPDAGTYTIRQLPVDGSNVVVPNTAQPNGTYGRFCYVPSLNGFYLINSVTENGYFYAAGDL